MWFTNTLVLDRDQDDLSKLRYSGGWMLALCQGLRDRRPEIELAIVTTHPGSSTERYASGGIDCFLVPMRSNSSERQQAAALKECARIVEEWGPDVIHIHGTERFFGLLSARRMVSAPTAISIQGLMQPYAEWYHFFGDRSLADIIRMHRLIEIPVMRGLIWDYRRFRKAARREREIILGNRHFMGRTLWDRAHLHSINPDARYYRAEEAIRRPFWDVRWDISRCRKRRIIYVNPNHPRKGAETLFKAADILKRICPELEVALVGTISSRSGYGRYVKKEIGKRNSYLCELGPLNAVEMAQELCRSHVFVSPSFIENSPNGICEAQLVGMPVVSSYTGGVPSLLKDRYSGLFFPTGDAPQLAATVSRIFEDDALAEMLGRNAHVAASARHDIGSIADRLADIYGHVIQMSPEGLQA